MNHMSISGMALAAMTGVLVLAWQAPGPQPSGVRLAQINPVPDSGTNVNPVTPTPGAPAKTAIPEKIGEPLQSGAAQNAPADNLGRQPPALDLKEPPPGALPPAGAAPSR